MSYTKVQLIRFAMNAVHTLACACQRLAESLHRRDALLTLGVARAQHDHASERAERAWHEQNAALALYRRAGKAHEEARLAEQQAFEVLCQNQAAVKK